VTLDDPAVGESAEAEVRSSVAAFLGAFASGPGVAERMTALRDLLDPHAVIVRAGPGGVAVRGVEEFVAPREALLGSGDLTDFREWPESGRVDLHGDIAAWWGTYAKSGTLRGENAGGRGTKGIHLVRRDGRWRVTAVVWEDDA
jgi:hypothetical protein